MQGKASGNDGRRSKDGQRRAAARPADDDSVELFVDPAPSQMRKERPPRVQQHVNPAANQNPARASDRRREQGRAPEPAEPKDTRTSMQQNQRVGGKGDGGVPTVATGKGGALSVDGGVSGAVACVRGPETGLALSLLPGSYTIGRARENDLVLKDIAASRKHLRLEVAGNVVRLVDLGSGNGTKVNGKRAGELELRHGDSIEIGASVLVFSASGRTATVAADAPGGEASNHVVAAADELARELSAKLRFGDENASEGVDGHRAKTRALRSADARAVADEFARQQAADDQQAREAKAGKRSNERLWNETFSNMPLSAVVPDEQRLQGTARDLQQPRPRERAPAPPPFIAPLPTGPVGTNVDDGYDDSRYTNAPAMTSSAAGSGGGSSFVQSVLMSAGAVVIFGAVALGFWAIFVRDDPDAVVIDPAVVAERDSEYATAISRAQDAFAKQDWATMREYAGAALQVKPGDQMAASYQRDAELRLEQAATAAAVAPVVAAPVPVVAPMPVVVAPVPVAAPVPAPIVVAAPMTAPPLRATPKPKPATKPARKGLSEDEARSRFERAIDAFRSKDNDTGCKLLSQVANRAPTESAWRGKADTLFLKRCGD